MHCASVSRFPFVLTTMHGLPGQITQHTLGCHPLADSPGILEWLQLETTMATASGVLEIATPFRDIALWWRDIERLESVGSHLKLKTLQVTYVNSIFSPVSARAPAALNFRTVMVCHCRVHWCIIPYHPCAVRLLIPLRQTDYFSLQHIRLCIVHRYRCVNWTSRMCSTYTKHVYVHVWSCMYMSYYVHSH